MADMETDSTTSTSKTVPYLADDFDTICSQATDQNSSFHKSLSDCFHALRESREEVKPLFANDPTEEPKSEGENGILNRVPAAVTVNFIDPTTKLTPGPKSNTLAKSNSEAGIDNVYEKLTYVFERDYGSTLRSIQYKNPRTGENSVISSLPVSPSLFGTVSDNPISAPLSEPSEWHTGPFCHVYIAACQGLEHYRAKIRPSLQAFVSQIESAATQPQLATTGGQGGHSAHFLVVYIPTGPKEKDGDLKPENVRSAVANRLSMVRRRFANNREDLDSSQHSKDSLDSNDMLDEAEEAEAGSLSLLSKVERNIYKKMAADFPNGKVCALSRASLSGKIESESVSSSGFAIKTQEWNSFNRCLGQVIVSGFKDRCRRYKDELRRLDSQRASEATARKNGSHVPPEFNEFNLANFFLVKESLAFTYEQMQLPAEALNQYDEFRSFLPQLSQRGYLEAKEDREHCEALKPDPDSPTLLELADSGDFIGFRKKLVQVSDLKPILDVMKRYLFARELCLLTKMEQPAELVARCRRFIKMMYAIMMRGIAEFNPKEQQIRKMKAAEWVIQFSWDVKCASEQYLLSMAEAMRSSLRDDTSQVTSPSLTSDSSDATRSEQALARQLSELLEVARLFYKELGTLNFPNGNPLKAYESALPADMFELWEPWEAPKPKDESSVAEKKKKGPPRRVSIMQRASIPEIEPSSHERREFVLETAFDSKESYEDIYLQISSSLVTMNKFAGRKRFAARHQGELAESLIRSGLLLEAAKILKKTVRICRWDHWDRCHFYRLFRLAFCQRSTAKPSEYLKTLVSAFSPRTTAVAPALALLYLQDDLEAVIGHESVGEARYGKLAFLEAQMKIENTSDNAKNLGSAFDRKQLAKKYCSVGETVRMQVILNSNLPRAIQLDSLQLFIVSFDSFTSIVENHESVEEEDAFKILTTGAPITLEPGANTYSFEWSPSTAGQYILSTAEIVWKQGYFYYDGMDLPENLYGVDVLPSEPTHSLAMEPAVLLPGHDQEVRISFNAAGDFIVAGKLQLSCSEGLTLIPPGEDPSSGNWQTSCEVDLGSYKAGETKLFTAHVRCGLIDNFSRQSISQQSSIDRAHGFSVKGITTYLHEESVDADHPMRNTMDLFAPILEKTALSVEGIDLVWVSERQRAIVSVQLVSNAPRYFSLESWNLVLPPPFSVTDGVDLNGDLLKCKVFNGDELALAFDCSVGDGSGGTGDEDPILQAELRDDAGEKFSLDLPIDLNEHYLQVLESDAPKLHGTTTATVALGTAEGQVGEPVLMTFKIDQESLSTTDRISYSISSDGSNWLVGGQVNGIIDMTSLTCDVIAIPTVAGPLSSFPSISLRNSLGNGEYSPLVTKMNYPPTFHSLARTSEIAVAFPNSNGK